MSFLKLKPLLWKIPFFDYLYLKVANSSRINDPDKHSPNLVDDDVDFVVEGFPRSANTFLTYGFMHATDFKFKLAHHFHSPSQFFYGQKKGKKCVIILRNPVDSITSFLIRFPHVDDDVAVDLYYQFHRLALKYLSLNDAPNLAVDFKEIVSGVGLDKVIKFSGFSGEVELKNEYEIFSEIERRSAFLNNGLDEKMVARPSENSEKNDAKFSVKKKLESNFDKELKACEVIYSEILNKWGNI